MTRHLSLILSIAIPQDIVVIIVLDNLDLHTRIACYQVSKEWASLLRGRIFGPHLRVTVNQFSKLLAAISGSPSLFDDMLQYTKCLTVVGNHKASITDDMIFLCTPRVIKAFAKIHALELEGPVNFASFTSFTKFVHFFPALDMLAVSSIKWKENSSGMYSTISIPHCHKNLRLCMDLSSTQINTVLLWLSANSTTADVRALNMDLTFGIRGTPLLYHRAY
ncbi:hypothetical protein BDQ12DRAFT_726012 [Crucibulum laeve]|uniref:F-box domain-containing protein n=1 Tax=Crucibulum laeve TaxID=68775 RepID=A0A5C3LRU4_9AGAR|nr:hypothetical protein BDQ12DRAFT_726012 [Crucibulum laeve]